MTTCNDHAVVRRQSLTLSYNTQTVQQRQNKIEDLNKDIEKYESENATLRAAIETASSGKEDSVRLKGISRFPLKTTPVNLSVLCMQEERTELLAELKALQTEKKACDAELATYAERDPELLERKKKAVQAIREATNVWTGNVCVYVLE